MTEHRISRRRLFGTGAAAGAGTLLAGTRAPSAGAVSRPGVARADVAVVGAGLAGLTAARELVKAGRSVIVLEARNRVGGRTWNRPIKGGEYLDAGAEFIGPTQDHIKALAAKMGVGTFPTYNTGNNVYWKDGIRLEYPASGPLGLFPPDPALVADIGQIVAKLDLMAESVPPGAPWDAPQAEDWDSQTFYSWVKDNQVNPEFMRVASTATQAIFGQEPRDISLLFALFYFAASGDEQHQGTFERNAQTAGGAQEERFDGGSHLISIRMARQLGDRVALRSPVRRIQQGKRGVEVQADGLRVRAKFAIVAIPPMLAGRIEYRPKLPALRDSLTQRAPMGSYAKVDAIYPEPFWQDDGLSGQVVSLNGPVTVTFDSTPPDGKPGVMLGFIGGHEARTWYTMSRSQRRAAVLDNFADYFGEQARNPIQYVENRWSDQRFSRGDPVAGLPPGVLLDFGTALREPARRIHWAGTETSTYWNGYMDGAVRSGERAAKEVLDRL